MFFHDEWISSFQNVNHTLQKMNILNNVLFTVAKE